MTTKSMIEQRLKEIKELNAKDREKEYIKFIEYLGDGLEETNKISCIFEEVAEEMLTKEQFIDLEKEVIHRKFRTSELYKTMASNGKFKDFVDDEIAIARDYIKKYKVIRNPRKGKNNL